MTAETSRITLCVSARVRAALAATAVLGLVATGCGGDDEEDSERSPTTPPVTTVAPPITTPPPETTLTQAEPDPQEEPRTVPPDEQQGDEEAIRSEAVFTGKGGRLTPPEIRVPPFIAIRVILRSSDVSREQGYALTLAGKRLFIGHTRSTDEVELDGLLPNKSYVGKSPQGNVRVVASAEPGP